VIPDEAVEAALAAQLSFKNQRGMDNNANLMRNILEAAAPHMMAAVANERDGDLFRFTISQREWLRKGLTK
jgi:hypothetical protein